MPGAGDEPGQPWAGALPLHRSWCSLAKPRLAVLTSQECREQGDQVSSVRGTAFFFLLILSIKGSVNFTLSPKYPFKADEAYLFPRKWNLRMDMTWPAQLILEVMGSMGTPGARKGRHLMHSSRSWLPFLLWDLPLLPGSVPISPTSFLQNPLSGLSSHTKYCVLFLQLDCGLLESLKQRVAPSGLLWQCFRIFAISANLSQCICLFYVSSCIGQWYSKKTFCLYYS